MLVPAAITSDTLGSNLDDRFREIFPFLFSLTDDEARPSVPLNLWDSIGFLSVGVRYLLLLLLSHTVNRLVGQTCSKMLSSLGLSLSLSRKSEIHTHTANWISGRC